MKIAGVLHFNKSTKLLFFYLIKVMRCFKQNERTKCKKYDPARTRTWNLLIRSQTPYPLGHEAHIVYKELYCYFTINSITNMHCNTVILCLHLNVKWRTWLSRFLFFSLPFFLHLANIIIVKGIGLMFPLKQLCLDCINVVNCTACNLRGFKNICRNFSVATKTISNQSQYYQRRQVN